jgi:hypothetical protein
MLIVEGGVTAGTAAQANDAGVPLLRGKKAIAAFLDVERRRLDVLIRRAKDPFVLQTDINGVFVTEAYASAFREAQKRTYLEAVDVGLFTRASKAS